ncbi:hypothetical protein PO909_025779 [Leuciscus waleckii]
MDEQHEVYCTWIHEYANEPRLHSLIQARIQVDVSEWKLASTGKELKDNFLRALAEREEANRSGKMTGIMYRVDSKGPSTEPCGTPY